jgi:hypothetical protein
MKKSFVYATLAVLAALFCVSTLHAQTPAPNAQIPTAKEIKESDKRVEKILKFNPPKPFGLKIIDDFQTVFFDMTRNCVKVSGIIKTYHLDPTAENKAKAIAAIEQEEKDGEAMLEAMTKPYEAAAAQGEENLRKQLMEQALAEYEAMPKEKQEEFVKEMSLWRVLSVFNYMMKAMKLVGPEVEFHEKVAKELKVE